MPFASKYLWWKTPDEAVFMFERVLAQVMNIGVHSDVQILSKRAADDVLREVSASAEAGQFNARSRAYCHYRLGLADVDCVRGLPVRRFA